jgi:hypothetical protein
VQITRLIHIPTVITLVITLLHVIGEFRHRSPSLFNSSAAGGGALVGVTGLVPIFGIYFAPIRELKRLAGRYRLACPRKTRS